jgi:hypothetical protein
MVLERTAVGGERCVIKVDFQSSESIAMIKTSALTEQVGRTESDVKLKHYIQERMRSVVVPCQRNSRIKRSQKVDFEGHLKNKWDLDSRAEQSRQELEGNRLGNSRNRSKQVGILL